MRIERVDIEEWGQILPETGVELFHRPEALRVITEHTDGEFHLLAGFKGQEPIGLFPVHESRKFGGRLLTSPPLGLGIGRLGPVVMPPSPKRHKQEITNRRFVEAVLEELAVDDSRTLLRLACSPQYTDPRPFQWDGFDVTPAYTYQLDLEETDREQLLGSFAADLRRSIRKRNEVDISIRTGGMEAAKQTYEAVEQRYAAQGYQMPLSWGFVRDLLEPLGDRARAYAAETDDGEFLGGQIILYSNETAYSWKGGTQTRRSVSPNSLLHWKIIEDILTDPELDSVATYDMYTANSRRLTKYKRKFAGEQSVYYSIESSGMGMAVAKGVYRMAAFRKSPLGEANQI